MYVDFYISAVSGMDIDNLPDLDKTCKLPANDSML
jgi:hypothetical protein